MPEDVTAGRGVGPGGAGRDSWIPLFWTSSLPFA